jgi:hypothetical protein
LGGVLNILARSLSIFNKAMGFNMMTQSCLKPKDDSRSLQNPKRQVRFAFPVVSGYRMIEPRTAQPLAPIDYFAQSEQHSAREKTHASDAFEPGSAASLRRTSVWRRDDATNRANGSFATAPANTSARPPTPRVKQYGFEAIDPQADPASWFDFNDDVNTIGKAILGRCSGYVATATAVLSIVPVATLVLVGYAGFQACSWGCKQLGGLMGAPTQTPLASPAPTQTAAPGAAALPPGLCPTQPVKTAP